jgi:hypothetical protein
MALDLNILITFGTATLLITLALLMKILFLMVTTPQPSIHIVWRQAGGSVTEQSKDSKINPDQIL